MNQKFGAVLSEEELLKRASPVWPYKYFKPGRPVDPERVRSLLEGLVDIHMHGAPAGAWLAGRPTIVSTCVEASENKISALVVKDHNTMTNNLAIVINDLLARLQKERELRGEAFEPVKVYGGLVLNDPVGGMNMAAVKTALGYGQCVEIWLPSVNSRFQHEAMETAGGIEVSVNGEPTADMKSLLDILADYNENAEGERCALGACHVSNREKFDILRYIKKRGMDVDVVIDHVTQELTIATEDECLEMLELGAYLQFAETSCVPWPGMQDWIINFDYSFYLLKSLLWKKGPEHLMLASDSGQPGHEFVPGWKSFLRTLLAQGISEENIRVMSTEVPKRVTGIR